jgi:Flp pilus assembly protein TadD
MNENPDDLDFKQKSQWQFKDDSEPNELTSGESSQLPATFLDLRANYNFKLDRCIAAVEDCTRAIPVEPPSDGTFYRDRASAYKKLGLFAEAKRDLETADASDREPTK